MYYDLKGEWEMTTSKGREEISPGRRELPRKLMRLEKQRPGEEMPLWSKHRGGKFGQPTLLCIGVGEFVKACTADHQLKISNLEASGDTGEFVLLSST